MLVVRSTPEAMRKLAAKPPYRILQRDEAAHIVWDTAGRRWGCVFFAPQEVTSHAVANETLPVKAVDRPCLVMAEAARNGQLEMSVADPDLNLEDSVSRPQPLRITLRGTWRNRENSNTIVADFIHSLNRDRLDIRRRLVRLLSRHRNSLEIGRSSD